VTPEGKTPEDLIAYIKKTRDEEAEPIFDDGKVRDAKISDLL
jgi:hypothetical protein